MAKGRGHTRKKDKDKARARHVSRPAGALPRLPSSPVPTPAANGLPAAPRRGVDATRGPVSGAYRAWAAGYGRRQAEAVGAQLAAEGEPVPPDLFLLAPLATRTVEAPDQQTISIQMGLPIVATRAGGVAVAPDRLAVAVLNLPEADPSGAMAMLGLGQAPDLPQPELLFAVQLPGEGLRGARAADAVAWYLARAIEAGDVAAQPHDLARAAGEMMALLRPHMAPRDVTRLDPGSLESYEGYGADADAEVVPLDISAAPARGGLTGLPGGVFLQDDGAPLDPLLADLRDYVIGLWPYEYFGLEAMTSNATPTTPATNNGRILAALSDLVRRLDEVLAESADAEDAALAADGQPPAWIAEQTTHYGTARQALRETRTAQEMLPRLGPILFDLEIPPADYTPPGWDEGDEDADNTDEESAEL